MNYSYIFFFKFFHPPFSYVFNTKYDFLKVVHDVYFLLHGLGYSRGHILCSHKVTESILKKVN